MSSGMDRVVFRMSPLGVLAAIALAVCALSLARRKESRLRSTASTAKRIGDIGPVK